MATLLGMCSGMLLLMSRPWGLSEIIERPFIYEIWDGALLECSSAFKALGYREDIQGFGAVSFWGGGYNEPEVPRWFVQNMEQSAAGVLFHSSRVVYADSLLQAVLKIVKRRNLLFFVVNCDNSPVQLPLTDFVQVNADVVGLTTIIETVTRRWNAGRDRKPTREMYAAVDRSAEALATLRVLFDQDFNQEETLQLLTLLGDLYRACGGLGLGIEKTLAGSSIHERVDG